jgi:hypothetical protein
MTLSRITPADGSSIAIVRRPSWVDHWGQLGWTGEIGPSTRLSVDVLDANGMILAADVASGTNLDSIPSVAHQQRLRLRANLSTADSRYTPTLSDWTVTFPEPVENPTASAWSGVVSSIPDVAPPVLAITSPEEGFVTLTNVVTVSGTAFDDISGVSNVRVLAGTVISTALTTNAFTNWTLTVAFPRRGTNQITVVAQDNAYPPNSTLLGQVVVLAE